MLCITQAARKQGVSNMPMIALTGFFRIFSGSRRLRRAHMMLLIPAVIRGRQPVVLVGASLSESLPLLRMPAPATTCLQPLRW